MQNAYVERNDGSIRRGLLDAFLFTALAEVRILAEDWRVDYNEERPHKSLGHLSPVRYAEKYYLTSQPEQQLYPQAVTENPTKIERNRFVDKEFEHEINSNP